MSDMDQPENERDAADGAAIDDAADGASSAADETTPSSSSEQELAESRDKYLRLAAEYDNFRRRTTKERQDAHLRGQGDLLKGMLDSLDDLSRFAHLDPAVTDTKTVVDGVTMIERKLLKTLAGHGLEILNPVDHPFDPNLHEAVATEPAASKDEDHLVARVFQPGYVFNGQLLRPARVVVKQWNG
ncbi:MAG: grpE [Gemmatimonadetes bacterium]|nr:grpE [Gemmatimonadota bacterium]